MRKSSIIILLTAIAFTTAAQNGRIGVTAGINSAKMVASFGGTTESTDGRIGIFFGVNYDKPLSELFSIQPALNFVQKGYKYKETDVNYVYTDEMRINYLEVPVNILFKPRMQEVQFFVGAGPSLAFAISGKEKENDNGSKDEWNLEFGNNEDEDDVKGVDVGLNFLTGIELHCGFNFTLNYNLGLTNIVPGGGSDGSIKNNYFGFRVGYYFKGKKK